MYNAFLADLQANDTTDSLNQDPYCDSNQNYNTFHDHHTKLKEKHLPYKFVKFENIDTRATSISHNILSNIGFIMVHGHNEGHIAHGILRLIKYRDKLYQDNKYATCLFVFWSWNETCFPQQIAIKRP